MTCTNEARGHVGRVSVFVPRARAYGRQPENPSNASTRSAMPVLKPCLTCGEPAPETYCEDHRPHHHGPHVGTFRQRGYSAAWDKLSRRARTMQDFCTDCGGRDNLALDHLPGAWERVGAGKRLRLGVDVEVVCTACNNRRGARRSLTVGTTPSPDPLGAAVGSRGGGHS